MLKDYFAGAKIAVTGAAGTVGSELLRQLLELPVAEVRALDNNENGLFFLDQNYRKDPRLHTFFCDVRELQKLERMLLGMDFVFHTAALKHVPLCERSPTEAVRTNILGVENIIRASINAQVSRVLFTSSDKAVNPTNVMGTSKLMGERLITAANALVQDGNGPKFSSTRFGNVAGSAGSVVPLFCHQIASGGNVTLTHRDMTRFLMTLHESVRLVLLSMTLACGGEVFVTKMPVARIEDIARVMVDIIAPAVGRDPASVEIEEIGPRPGEKMYEELISDEEVRRTYEIGDLFAVLPAFRNIYDNIAFEYSGNEPRPIERVYNSQSEVAMTLDEVGDFLRRPGVLPDTILERIQEAEKGSNG